MVVIVIVLFEDIWIRFWTLRFRIGLYIRKCASSGSLAHPTAFPNPLWKALLTDFALNLDSVQSWHFMKKKKRDVWYRLGESKWKKHKGLVIAPISHNLWN